MHPFKEFVDHIYVLTCTKYKNTRAKGLMETIGNLGLSDITDLMISTCSPIDMLFKQHIDPVNEGASRDCVVDLFLNHYHAIKTGYDLGYNKILVLEDDACILKDQERIRRMLEELKDRDYPCIALDFGGGGHITFMAGFSKSPHPSWGFHNGRHFNGTHAYILNRTGMKRWISYCERTVSSGNDKLKFDVSDRVYPHLLAEGESILYPADPVVIQHSTSATGRAVSGWNKHYRDFNVKIENYIESEETPFTIVYASDGNDYERLRMSVFSVRKFLGNQTKIILLTDSNKDLGVPDVLRIDPVPVLSAVGFHSNGWNRKWPFATLFRMAIPLIPELEQYDRVLYLDTDILIRSSDAQRLADVNLTGMEALAVADCEARQWRIDHVMNEDLSPEAVSVMTDRLWDPWKTRVHAYANAGVTLWNLDRIRQNGVDWYRQRLQWFWEAECRGRFRFLDQDFMNVMMETDTSLNKRFNWFGGDKDTNCIIQHFVAGTKGAMGSTAEFMGYNKEVSNA